MYKLLWRWQNAVVLIIALDCTYHISYIQLLDGTLLLPNFILCSDFISFSLMSIFLPTSYLLYQITCSCHISLGSFWLWQFLRFCLFVFDGFDNFDDCWEVVCRMSVNLDLYDFFFIVRSQLWVFERKSTSVKCHFHLIISNVPATNMTYHCQGSSLPGS